MWALPAGKPGRDQDGPWPFPVWRSPYCSAQGPAVAMAEAAGPLFGVLPLLKDLPSTETFLTPEGLAQSIRQWGLGERPRNPSNCLVVAGSY